jgi:hypothetical protein
MTQQADSTKAPKQESAEDERLNKSADDAAEQGEETEQKYDESHDIFTK